MPHVHVVSDAGGSRPKPWRVLRDHPFMALTGIFAVMFFNELVFMTIVPLWAITMTDAPKPVLGALFALNTIMAVLLQVPATKYAVDVVGPAALTFLAIGTGGWGWWVIAGIFAATALVVRPVMSWVERTPRNPAVHPT